MYRAVDDAVGRLLAGFDDDVVTVVFSMHGAAGNGADVPSMVLLPELLWRLQTGTSRFVDRTGLGDAGSDRPVVPDRGWTPYVQRSLRPTPSVFDRVRAAAAGRVADARQRLRRRMPAEDAAVVGVLGHPIPPETELRPDEVGDPPFVGGLADPARVLRASWPRLEAFGVADLLVRRARASGSTCRAGNATASIAPGEYDQVCERIEREVRASRDGHTGEPLVARIDRLRSDDPTTAHGGPDADLQVHPGQVPPTPSCTRWRAGSDRCPTAAPALTPTRGLAFVAGPGIEASDLGDPVGARRDRAPLVQLLGRSAVTGVEGTPLLPDPGRPVTG